MNQPNLSVELAPQAKRSLVLPNPVMVASGTFGYGLDYAKVFDIQRLGAIVTKTTTLAPRRGNAPVRIAETPAGMLNSIGLQNVGVSALVRDFEPEQVNIEALRTLQVVDMEHHVVNASHPELGGRLGHESPPFQSRALPSA